MLRLSGVLGVSLVVLVSGCVEPPGESTAEVVAEASHALWVTDRGSNRVLAFDAAGELVGTVIDADQVDRPSSVRRGPDGLVYLASFGNAAVLRFDLAARTRERFYYDALLEEPVELAFRGDDLFVLGNDTQNAVRLDRDGLLLHEVHPIAKDAHDFAFGPDGALYVAAVAPLHGAGAIQVWDADAEQLVRDFAPADEVSNATSLAFAADGTLFVADYPNSRLLRYDAATATVLDIIEGPDLARPVSIDFGPDGLLYVIDDHGVSRWDADSAAYVDCLIPVGSELVRPRSLTFVPAP